MNQNLLIYKKPMTNYFDDDLGIEPGLSDEEYYDFNLWLSWYEEKKNNKRFRRQSTNSENIYSKS